MIPFGDFLNVDIRAGVIVEAQDFPEARKPAYRLLIDFGPELGRKRSSAQITRLYQPADLIGKTILAVVNFAPKQIGPLMSEVLVLGLETAEGAISLIGPDHDIPPGARLH